MKLFFSRNPNPRLAVVVARSAAEAAASSVFSSSSERNASATSAITVWSTGGRASVSARDSAASLGRLDSCGWRS